MLVSRSAHQAGGAHAPPQPPRPCTPARVPQTPARLGPPERAPSDTGAGPPAPRQGCGRSLCGRVHAAHAGSCCQPARHAGVLLPNIANAPKALNDRGCCACRRLLQACMTCRHACCVMPGTLATASEHHTQHLTSAHKLHRVERLASGDIGHPL